MCRSPLIVAAMMPAAGAHGKFTMMFASPFGEGKVDRGVGHRHADPPSSNSPNGSECDCVGGLVGHQLGARLPDAADSFDRWFPVWRRSGFDLQTCWPSVIGALWSANRRRESGRRQQQYRHRVRRSCSARWIHAARCDSGQLMEHGALQQSQVRFYSRSGAGGRHGSGFLCPGCQSVVPR